MLGGRGIFDPKETPTHTPGYNILARVSDKVVLGSALEVVGHLL